MIRRSGGANPKIFVVKRRSSVAQPVSTSPVPIRFWWFFLPLILIAGLYYSPWLSVKEVQIQTGEGASTPSSVSEPLRELRSRPIFSPAINRLVDSLISSRSDIVGLNCQRGLPSTLRCQITVRTPKLLWQRSGQQWLVDASGLAYQITTVADPALIIVEDQSTAVLSPLTSIASREVVDGYWQVHRRLAEKNIRLEKVVVSDALYFFRARVSGWQPLSGAPADSRVLEVWLSLNHSLDNQLASFFGLLEQKGTAVIDRVDLRVPGTIYYH